MIHGTASVQYSDVDVESGRSRLHYRCEPRIYQKKTISFNCISLQSEHFRLVVVARRRFLHRLKSIVVAHLLVSAQQRKREFQVGRKQSFLCLTFFQSLASFSQTVHLAFNGTLCPNTAVGGPCISIER